MRIFNTQISSPSVALMASISRGFTLIEVLVVVVILAIAMSVVVAGFTGADQEQSFKGFAERMVLRIEMARDRAVQTNNEWGVYVDADEISFAEFDHVSAQWLPRIQRPFRVESTDDNFRYRVKVEAYPGQVEPSDDDEDTPSIILFSSGETTPFELSIEPEAWTTNSWTLVSDGFSRTVASRVTEDDSLL
ncbi:MAG: type II secretion system protein GspH [Pseudomonadales bacterium]|nr:type II secretion system protein GspH [Pseudomonadales bacterium]